MAEACAKAVIVTPMAMFKALRTQMDELGFTPDYRIAALSELPGIVATA
jgi:2-haloacid dehalogenase